ncbi:MAG: type VII secretion protein EccE [Mycobacteriaceae bacterium]|nr:type VII secretion protein EccE [Mycobacteriaceae bacterium]
MSSPAQPTLHGTEFWLFRLFPLRAVLPSALLATIAGLVAAAFDAPLYAVVLSGAPILALGLTRVRGANLMVSAGKAATFGWRRIRNGATPTTHESFNAVVPDSDGDVYGMRWDGQCVLTMLRINPGPAAPVRVSPTGTHSDRPLPLADIASCLTQFDVALSAIDVVSTGYRTVGESPAATLYHRLLGQLPATAQRTVWLVLRLDPLANAEAISNRGGGEIGTVRTAVIATRRVANRLAAQGTRVFPVPSEHFDLAVAQLTGGSPLDELTERWSTAEHGSRKLTSYEIEATALDSATFAKVFLPPSRSTTLTVRLRPAETQGGKQGEVALSALVRYDTASAIAAPPLPGLRRLAGSQHRALLSTLPIAGPAPAPGANVAYGPVASLAGIMLPTGGCGQLIGADDQGRGVAVPLAGPGVRRVEIIGTLQLAQKLILRAVASGLRIVVQTHRTEAWSGLTAAVDSAHLLSLHNPRYDLQRSSSVRSGNVIVYDGVEPPYSVPAATLIHLRDVGSTPQLRDPDVTVIQSPNAPNSIAVTTATSTVVLRVVSTPDEHRYLAPETVSRAV